MNQHYFVGVDGGASKTIVRLEDAAANCLGEVTTGPANIQINPAQAWESILNGFQQLMNQCGLTKTRAHFYAGIGIAGCEIATALRTFMAAPHPFAKCYVTTDAEIACLGAHGGEAGAVIIAGTGMIGMKRVASTCKRVGGWGFPHDDEGGGAWLGLQAVRVTLQWLDARLPSSPLSQSIYAHFQQDQAQLVTFANEANASAFAALAPWVMRAASAGDITAISLLKQSARCVEHIAATLEVSGLPLALLGGLAAHLQAYLRPDFREALRPALHSPQAGAILFAKQQGALDLKKNNAMASQA